MYLDEVLGNKSLIETQILMPVLCMLRHVLLSLNLFCPLSRALQYLPPFRARRVIMPYLGGFKGRLIEFVVQLRTSGGVAIRRGLPWKSFFNEFEDVSSGGED